MAEAYGLSREQYAHVLSSFSHKSFPGAPALCLGAFDELATLGLAAFTKKHDPYWDIPLVETLPRPVIDLPVAVAVAEAPPAGSPPTAEDSATPAAAPTSASATQLPLIAGESPRKRGRRRGT